VKKLKEQIYERKLFVYANTVALKRFYFYN